MRSLTIALELDVDDGISDEEVCAYITKATLTHPEAATAFEPNNVWLAGIGRSMLQRSGVEYSALGFRKN